MFARGKATSAAKHRLSQCLHATDCGRICERVIKGLGKADVWCVDPKTLETTYLYPALENEEFACPEGRF